MVLTLAAPLILLVAVIMFSLAFYEQFSLWWLRRIDTYATWIVDEFDAMFEALTLERARQFITIAVFGSAAIGFLTGGWLLAVLFGTLGYFLPRGFLMLKRRRRLTTIDDQLVDALHLMSNSLKSGMNLQQSIEMAYRELKPPIADEFGRIIKEISLGRLIDDALRRFSERTPLDDVKLTIDSIVMLRETGGNLTETFEVIAHTVVERKKVEGKIKAMTMQGMAQGAVIGAMPIGMLLLFSFIAPELMRPFFTTFIGWVMLILVFVLDGVGVFLMFKRVQVDV